MLLLLSKTSMISTINFWFLMLGTGTSISFSTLTAGTFWIAAPPDKFDKVSVERLLVELERLQGKKDRVRIVVNEDLDRIIAKINNIENYLKLKSNT